MSGEPTGAVTPNNPVVTVPSQSDTSERGRRLERGLRRSSILTERPGNRPGLPRFAAY